MTISRVQPEVEHELLAEAKRQANAIGVAMSFSVVDAAGYLTSFARMPNAGWATVDLATGKARAAVAFSAPTADLATKWASANLFTTALIAQHDGHFVPAPGGLPILIDNVVVGAIGASGGTGAQDAAVLHAALEVVSS